MKPHFDKSVTLVELLTAIAMIGIVIIGIFSIDLFSRSELQATDNRAKLQNQVSFILEHMTKQIKNAIGDVNQTAVNVTNIGGDPSLIIWIDNNSDGQRNAYPADKQIAYRYNASPNYQMWYYSDYSGSPTSYQVIGQRISSFTRTLSLNYVDVNITACWNCSSPSTCGSRNNPLIQIINRIVMPSVSTN